MRLFRALARYLQFRLAPDPVENLTDQQSDADRAVDYCEIVAVNEDDFPLVHAGYGTWGDPAELDALDIGSVPTPPVPRIHAERTKL